MHGAGGLPGSSGPLLPLRTAAEPTPRARRGLVSQPHYRPPCCSARISPSGSPFPGWRRRQRHTSPLSVPQASGPFSGPGPYTSVLLPPTGASSPRSTEPRGSEKGPSTDTREDPLTSVAGGEHSPQGPCPSHREGHVEAQTRGSASQEGDPGRPLRGHLERLAIPFPDTSRLSCGLQGSQMTNTAHPGPRTAQLLPQPGLAAATLPEGVRWGRAGGGARTSSAHHPAILTVTPLANFLQPSRSGRPSQAKSGVNPADEEGRPFPAEQLMSAETGFRAQSIPIERQETHRAALGAGPWGGDTGPGCKGRTGVLWGGRGGGGWGGARPLQSLGFGS